MKSIKEIKNQLVSGEFEFTRHAFKRAIERNISKLEITQAGEDAKIIENYPDDQYSPSCLLFGFTKTKRPLHIQVSYINIDFIKIITLYEPDETEWVYFTKRR